MVEPANVVVSFCGAMATCVVGGWIAQVGPDMGCVGFYMLRFLVAGWLMGWLFPDGVPGATLAVVAYCFFRYDATLGPTAKSLDIAFYVGFGIGTVVLELTASVIRRRKETQER